jgi:gluconolactonase
MTAAPSNLGPVEPASVEVDVIAEGLAFPEGPIALDDGSVLLVEIAAGLLVRIDQTGRKHVVADLGGGPNGAAIGPDGAVYVCNNGGFTWHREPGQLLVAGTPSDHAGGWIERVDLATGNVERLFEACGDRRLNGPNDLAFDQSGGFYFTDHGKPRERLIDRGAVYYATADGQRIQEVVFPISLPNGIALSPDEKQLYVAETETARLWRFSVTSPGRLEQLPFPSPNGGDLVFAPGGFQRFDGIKVEAGGNIAVATLERGGITTVTEAGEAVDFVPLGDRRTSNLCFAGSDRRTVYVTLSSSGRLVRLAWPRPGHRLPFLDLC